MKCPKCKKGKLHVRNVYSAGECAETRNLSCSACGHKASSVTFLVPKEQHYDRDRSGGALAIAVGSITLVLGVVRHGDPLPLQVGAAGIGFMAFALFVGHGSTEAVLTILGVALLGWAHLRNLRHGM